MYVNSSDWKWLLDSFADRVASKEYKKTDYQYWRRLKNYDSAHIYYINGHDIVVEDAEKDLVENGPLADAGVVVEMGNCITTVCNEKFFCGTVSA